MLAIVAIAPRALGAEPRERPLGELVDVATPNPCLERSRLLEDVEGFLERSSVDERVRVKVGDTQKIPWFSIRLGQGEPTSRKFSDLPADCAEARRVVALSIALAIDAVAPESREPPPRPFAALVYGMVATPLPDRVLVGGGAALRLRLSRWLQPSVGVVALVSSNQRLGATPSLAYDSRLVASRLEACAVALSTRVVQGVFCAGSWLGAFTTDPGGLPNGAPSTTFWAAIGSALELHVIVTPRFGVHLGADALVSLRDTRVEAQSSEGNVAITQEIPTLVGTVRLGPELFF